MNSSEYHRFLTEIKDLVSTELSILQNTVSKASEDVKLLKEINDDRATVLGKNIDDNSYNNDHNVDEYVLKPSKGIQFIDPNDCWGRVLSKKMEANSFGHFIGFSLCITLYMVGLIVSLMAWLNVLPSEFLNFCILCVPQLVNDYWIMNRKLISMAFKQFTAILMNLWSVVFFVSMLILLRHRENYTGIVLFHVNFLITNFNISMFDSLPKWIRFVMLRLILLAGILIYTTLWLGIYYNWIDMVENLDIEYFKQLKISLIGTAASAMQNMMIFMVKMIVIGFTNKDCLMCITDSVQLAQMRKGYADKLKQIDSDFKVQKESFLKFLKEKVRKIRAPKITPHK